MNRYEAQYHQLVKDILNLGEIRETRTGQTRAIFNRQISLNLDHGFPMLSGRKINWNTVLTEYLWMTQGFTNVAWLHEHGVHIWDQWADADGDIGQVYGYHISRQWGNVMAEIRINPMGRRHIIELWTPYSHQPQALPACYHTFQFYVAHGKLNLTVSFRSSDVAVGLPHDAPVLALFLHQAARECNMKVGELVLNLTDAHINEENTGAMYMYTSGRKSFEMLPMYEYKKWLSAEHYKPHAFHDLKDYNYDDRPFPKLIVKP